MIQHPEYFSKLRRNSESFEMATKAALEMRDYFTYIALHERSTRLKAFMFITDQIDDAEYWDLLRVVYADTENFWENTDDWESLLTSTRPGRESFTDKLDVFAALPDELTLYRGYSKGVGRMGWAWTTDRRTGVWFATGRVHERKEGVKESRLLTGTALKSDAIGYLGLEREVVIPWEMVTIVSEEEVAWEEAMR